MPLSAHTYHIVRCQPAVANQPHCINNTRQAVAHTPLLLPAAKQ